ncbi:hypothetical protein QQ020_14490 [Fulvivirgaceae bacterium BMA12]|uniref:Lipoprotein n=1 Tax=Agaribacillus aureus TaxID=3051825 RepID=A0ABT8L6A7_9BACT|nr:hypothetical protein [Fulvivirgaceae bacterium BMA12]
MKIIKVFALPLICFIIFVLQSCSGDDINDPCIDENPVSASFTIYETFQLGLPEKWEAYDTDTVNTKYVLFTALEEDASYEWILGAEVISDQSFIRHSFPRGTSIEVELRVNKQPNADCFPEDDGFDTLKRTFYVTETLFCDALLNGSYVGHDLEDENSERTIAIDVCYEYPNPFNDTEPRIFNLVPGCDIYGFGKQNIAYKQMYFGDNGVLECLNPTGFAYIYGKSNDSIRIDYSIDKSAGDIENSITKTFIGVRK